MNENFFYSQLTAGIRQVEIIVSLRKRSLVRGEFNKGTRNFVDLLPAPKTIYRPAPQTQSQQKIVRVSGTITVSF